jgi:hypothetical protein
LSFFVIRDYYFHQVERGLVTCLRFHKHPEVFKPSPNFFQLVNHFRIIPDIIGRQRYVELQFLGMRLAISVTPVYSMGAPPFVFLVAEVLLRWSMWNSITLILKGVGEILQGRKNILYCSLYLREWY